jgi:hypothetical protein
VGETKALLIGFNPDIRLHHRRTEDNIKLILLQLLEKAAEGATAFRLFRGGGKRLRDRYHINLFQNISFVAAG